MIGLYSTFIKRSALWRIFRNWYHFDADKLDVFLKKHYGFNNEISDVSNVVNDMIGIEGNKGRGQYTDHQIVNKHLKRTIKMCNILGGVRFEEFWRNKFESKTWNERRKLIPCRAQNDLYIQVNPSKYLDLFEDKEKCYEFFKKYYCRKIVSVSDKKINDKVFVSKVIKGFLNNNDSFFIKPLNGAGGVGVKLIKAETVQVDDICQDYQHGFVLEERIIQIPQMAVFHQQSLNTVRVQTVLFNDCVEIKWPCLRMGRGGSVIDNIFSGGIFVGIDSDTGITFGSGSDAACRSYEKHPDTQVPLSGYQIPNWGDLKNKLKEMALLCKDCHIIGWDMALTEKGWVMVECNWGPEIIYQDISRENFYKDFINTRKRLYASMLKKQRNNSYC